MTYHGGCAVALILMTPPDTPTLERVPDPDPNAPNTAEVAQAVKGLDEAGQADVATAAIRALGDSATADLVTAAMGTLPTTKQDELIGQFAPDQLVTNWIWRRIVTTFSAVLAAATLALIAAVFVEVEAAAQQLLLTLFTTSGGILAGFISGRASSARGRA